MRETELWQLALLAIGPLIGVLASVLRQKKRLRLADLVVGLIGAVAGVSVAYLAFARGQEALDLVYRNLSPFGAQIAVVSAVLLLGGAAHWFKRKSQLWYGVFEVTFAIAVAAQVATGMSPEEALLSQWVALGGTVYVVARGLNNIKDANTRERPDASPNPALNRTDTVLSRGSAG